MINPDRPLNRREASDYLLNKYGIRRSPGTLAKQAVTGGGPQFRKAGRAVVYERAALDGYALEITSAPVRSTSELPAQYRQPRAADRTGVEGT